MKYHIDTIPVWDAVKLDQECFLCSLQRKIECTEAERFLGASVMEPDVRIQVNEKGFCAAHHKMLFGMNNRLGHALMLESHIAETKRRLSPVFRDIAKRSDEYAECSLGAKLNGKQKSTRNSLLDMISRIDNVGKSCILCDSIHENMERYYRTFFYLYENDPAFTDAFRKIKGVCLEHLPLILSLAVEYLPEKKAAVFIRDLLDKETASIDRIGNDVSWFIKKFDYRYEKEDWKNSRDAVERAVNELRTWCVGKEPYDEN